MSLSFCVLASGSSGNCAAVGWREGGRARWLLIDAGLSPRMTATRLAEAGISIDDVTDILLTHMDWDHCHRGWQAALEESAVTVHVHRRHQRAAGRSGLPVRATCVFDDAFEVGELAAHGTILAHDQLGSIAFVISHNEAKLGFATDLGRVPHALLESFRGLSALAIESNYDPSMQRESERPEFLKRRIMGGSGHLSNEQALDAVIEIDRQSELQHIALLHLSRECNCPLRVAELYRRRAPHLVDRLRITSQQEPTSMMSIAAVRNGCAQRESLRQLELFVSDMPH